MLFNSVNFIFIFFPITFIIYFYLNYKKYYNEGVLFLSLASLFFYGYWDIIYIPLILFSIILNFIFGKYLCLKQHNKKILFISILFNVLLLGYYKYTDFFIENFNGIFATNVPLQHVVLPLGISFFTFTQIAFLVDCYNGKVKEASFIRYLLFVTYFPHLLAGPIIHHKEMMPQFEDNSLKTIDYKNISIGITLFFVGLFKKMVLADFFSKYANYGFSQTGLLSMSDAWITSLSYTFQLYFDFSAYTDMAIGISFMFNIKLSINFNSPYKAINIQDFWKRWHITLSRFLRDYIYIPLGGNQKGIKRTYVNVFIVFLIGGLWHGAGWTFIFWGALHGAAQIVVRLYSRFFGSMNKILAWFITFNFINITWIFFRAENLDYAFKILKGLVNINNIYISKGMLNFANRGLVGVYRSVNLEFYAILPIVFGIIFAIISCVSLNNSNKIIEKDDFNFKAILKLSFLIICCFFASISVEESPFLYFNF